METLAEAGIVRALKALPRTNWHENKLTAVSWTMLTALQTICDSLLDV